MFQAVINLIEERRDILIALIFQRNPRASPERHGKVAVKSAGRIYHDRKRIHRICLSESAAEKVSQRCFHRGFCFAVPVHSQDKIPENVSVFVADLVRDGHPDMANNPRPFYLRQHHRFMGMHTGNTGRAFPRRSEYTRRHSSLSFFSRSILPVNAARISLLQPGCLIHIPIHFIPPICIPDRSSTELSPVSCYSPAISTSHTRMLPSETNHPSLFPDSLYMRNPKATSLFTYNTARES